MSAREKLNSAVVNGSIAIAAIVGLVFQSWAAFFLTAAVLIGSGFVAGEIRFRPDGPRR